ncbi:Translation initiation factor 2 [hydrothermal vent metagenome]|uniref:Translation initiation factor 2 n=1 Tax=hydrothermal vent metagenome TaxID=652676 RepID=A0A1W1EK44_9ZZZZ
MGKVKILEIAAEAGKSNAILLDKAKELGFDVKVANSTVSEEQAEILVNYVMDGTLPDGFKKPLKKSKITVTRKITAVKKETPKVVTEDKKSTDTKEESQEVKEEIIEEQEKPKIKLRTKKSLSRGGITVVKRARPLKKKAPIKPMEAKSTTPKKKKPKKSGATAKDSGKKLEIMNNGSFGGGTELFAEEEVVLLDFSDKNIYEDMKRQEQKRKEGNKQRGMINNGSNNKHFNNRPKTIKRSSKKRKNYSKVEENVVVSSIEIPEDVRVYEFAEKVGKSVGEVITVLFTLGTMVTKNDFLDKDSIEILAEEFEVEVTTINPLDALDYSNAYDDEEVDEAGLEERPPVITIMGHVDHGKTSLLDKIRLSKVVEKEAGGITQHVGAYQVEKDGKKITFIDTPGHAAFTEMRARGTQATDIVLIIIAADDGIKPQTKEAISHAKDANVPIIVVITKIDKESANVDMVKSQLSEHNLLTVDWGGEIESVNVSSHSGEGIDELLDVILIQAEVMELKASPKRKAKAIVVESSLEKGFGPVANVIMKDGTLSVGDTIVVGTTYGRVRTLINDHGQNVKSIGPSTPASVMGLNEVPTAGEILISMESEKETKELAQKRYDHQRAKELSRSTKATLDDLSSLIAEGQLKSLPVIIKTDVQGSLEAIKGSLEKLKNEEVKVNIIHEGVGGVTESDVSLASASEHTVILGFNVRPTGSVKKRAKELGIEIKSYSIIYELIDDVKAFLGGMMSPVLSEEVTGQAEVRETFIVDKVGTIAGCKVTDGSVIRGGGARLIRDGVVVYESTISSLKRFNDDAREVKNGYECGIMLANYNDIKVGDFIETFKEVEEQASL